MSKNVIDYTNGNFELENLKHILYDNIKQACQKSIEHVDFSSMLSEKEEQEICLEASKICEIVFNKIHMDMIDDGGIKMVDYKPKEKNKYNLKIEDIRKMRVKDMTKICEPVFHYNPALDKYMIYQTQGNYMYEPYNEYILAINDDGTVKYSAHSEGGMTTYNFKEFYNPAEIENEDDLKIQEKLLKTVNYLLDEEIFERGF